MVASLGSVTCYDGRPSARPGAGAEVTILRRMVPAMHWGPASGTLDSVTASRQLAPPPYPRSGSRMMADLQAASTDTKGGTATSAAIAAAAAAASDMIRLFMAVLPLPVAAGRLHAMSRRRPGCDHAAIRLRPGHQPAVAEELARP